MLNREEKRYIRKALIERLKYVRYMVYVMIIICFLFIALPMSFQYLLDRDILHAITSILGIIYPTIFFGGFYLFLELISGNQIFKFVKGDYIVYREILHSKYKINSKITGRMQGNGTHWLRETFNCFCDTQNHTKVLFVDENSYRNAEVGGIVIIIQFSKNQIEAFALQKNW